MQVSYLVENEDFLIRTLCVVPLQQREKLNVMRDNETSPKNIQRIKRGVSFVMHEHFLTLL